jgi:methyl-accepting chemotaxis protein
MMIKAKVALTAVASVVAASSAMLIVLKTQQSALSEQVHEEVDRMARAEARSIASGVYNMVRAQDQLLQQKVRYDLNVARQALQDAGGARLDDESPTSWNAVNQFTKEASRLELPTMLIGETPIAENSSFSVE